MKRMTVKEDDVLTAARMYVKTLNDPLICQPFEINYRLHRLIRAVRAMEPRK